MPITETLSQEGPWLIFFTGEGMWADAIWSLNSDGSGLTILVEGLILMPHDPKASISPNGGYLAFITARDRQYRGLELKLLKMPEGQVTSLTSLSSAAIESELGADPAQTPPKSLLAITQKTNLAWSPEGRRLAFVGAQEATSSDIYLYSIEEDRITHLTDEPHDAFQPSWSPDGKYLLYFEAEERAMTARTVQVENGKVTNLYDLVPSSDEVVLGWSSENIFTVCTESAGDEIHYRGENVNLRQVDIQTRTVTSLWEEPFTDAALEPGSTNVILFIEGDGGGIYHLDTENGTSWRIVEDEAYDLIWSEEAGLFFAVVEFGILAINSQGDFIDLDMPESASAYPVIASEVSTLLWKGSGLWIGSLTNSIDNPPQQIYDKPTDTATITPDAKHIFFFSEEGLLVAHSPDYKPVLLQAVLVGHQFGWIQP